MTTKKQALANFLGVKSSDIEKSQYDNSMFEVNGEEYAVLTDRQADKRTEEYIRDSLCHFRPEWLANYTGLSVKTHKAVAEGYENSNEAIKKLIGGATKWKQFVNDCIWADGRGHFLSGYDGEENEQDNYFIYRV